MASSITSVKAALTRELNKLTRQEDAIDATKAMIELLEAQVKIAEKAGR